MPEKRKIFDEMTLHFRACYRGDNICSDTWRSAFQKKGDIYTTDELDNMLSPGSRVNAWIRNLSYYLDSSILDLQDQVQMALMETGEPDLGNPYKDTVIGGQTYSSLFLFHVITAAEIIKQIADANIENPRVMEIGGGYGTLMGLLRGYYGNRITLYSVDLPETLSIQEWYLRNRFPVAPVCYKSNHDNTKFVTGGLNFINAHVIHSQDVSIDVVINIISMGEMPAAVANKYIAYVERNISESGIFFFMNAHGQCIGAIPDVTEYNFDEYWVVQNAHFASQFEGMCWIDLLRLVFKRTRHEQDKTARRFVLRLLLNGFHYDLISRQPQQVKEFLSAVRNHSLDEAVSTAKALLIDMKDFGMVSTLADKPLLPQDAFHSLKWRPRSSSVVEQDRIGTFTSEIALIQTRLISLMATLSKHSFNTSSTDTVIREVSAITEDFLNHIAETRLSEYWSGYIASILFPLGRYEEARNIILETARQSDHVVWLIRFTHLLVRYGFVDDAAILIDRLYGMEDIPWFAALKLAELQHQLGRTAHAHEEIVRQASDKLIVFKVPVIAKTAIRIGAIDLFCSFCDSIYTQWKEAATATLVDVAAFVASEMPRAVSIRMVDELTRPIRFKSMTPDLRLDYGATLLKIGHEAKGISFVQSICDAEWNNYYILGKVGRLLYWSGYYDWAEQCLHRALSLGPRNIQQLRFVGNIRLSAGCWNRAAECLEAAAALKPYMRSLWGRAAYCRLPTKVRNAGIFGTRDELDMIFQEEQDYYHDIGLKYK